MAWREDLCKSTDAFDRLILPVLPMLVRGKYIRVEGTPEEIAQYLDQNIGIDAMLDCGNVTYGLGSRIQFDSGVWNTFTIRCSRESGHITELEKLRKAIQYDSMRPHMTLQAYVENNKLQTIGVAWTKDIIEYIDAHDCPIRTSFDGSKRAQFVFVKWDEMKDAGYVVRTFDNRMERCA